VSFSAEVWIFLCFVTTQVQANVTDLHIYGAFFDVVEMILLWVL
jgi:hypothetical protein